MMIDPLNIESVLHERRDLTELKAYVESVLGLKLRLQPWEHVKILPYALRTRYEFLVTEVLGARCLILKERPQQEASVADVARHMQAINNFQALNKLTETGDLMIFVTDALASYQRKRLVEKGVQFIVPGNQLYLPAFGVDLREYFRRRLDKPQTLSPATQYILIHYLLQGWQSPLSISRSTFEKPFSYTKMTITRVIKELVDLGVLHSEKVMGKATVIFHRPLGETWEMTKEHMRTPVKRSLWLNAVPEVSDVPMLRAGEAALSEMSLLAAPRVSCFAMTTEQFDVIRACSRADQWAAYGQEYGAWGSVKPKSESTYPYVEVPQGDAACCIQLWSYEPLQSSTVTGSVDPLSLYLSLQDEQDERIQICLDEMMENLKW